MEETKNTVSFLELEEVDEEAFEDLYQKLQEYANQENKDAVIAPETKLEVRNWLMSYMKLEDEIDELKEYLEMLDERYLQPSRDRIEAHKANMDLLKKGMLQFLNNAEEKKVIFPELATVSRWNPEDKIIYPEEEKELKELAEKLFKEGSEFVVPKPALDKKKIKEYWEKNKKLPIESLDVDTGRESVRVTRAKNKSKEK
jgi:predicted outer membrane protein